MEISFRNSNIGCYQIVEIDGHSQKYIMDTSTLSPKRYCWGLLPKNITVDMIELDKKNASFETKSKTLLGTSTIAIMIQPIVKIGYDMLKNLFVNYEISQQIFLKIVLYFISMLISYFIIWNSLRKAHKIAAERLPKESKKVRLTLRTTKRRELTGYIFLFLNLACLLFFLMLNDGEEGAILVINGLISLALFLSVWTMPPISFSYRNKFLTVEKIEEL